MRNVRTKAALLIGLGALVFASSATAATTTPFGCRASVARVGLGGSTLTEPTVANPDTAPCNNDSKAVSTVDLLQSATPGLTAGPAGAFTHSVFSQTNSFSPGATAVVNVTGVTIPSPSGAIMIVGPVEAVASYACSNGQLTSMAQSTLDVINVNGKNMTLPAPGTPTTIQLGGGSYIAVNEKIQTSNSLTERVLDVHLAGLADIVVGEAKVTQSTSDPCAGTNGPPPVLEICPPGSTLAVVAQFCEIILPGGERIIVSRPFAGPSGGTVIALSVARKKYHSPCLYGPGPKFILVAKKVHGRVFGTPKSDRILGLGAFERIAGLGGNDCIDGKGGNQTIWDGNGKERIWFSGGHNRVGIGNGNSMLTGRTGHDWITAGNGNDTVHTGSGNTRLDVGLGKDHVFGGKGRNRFFVASGRAVVSCGSGKHNTAFLRKGVSAYAAKHGCQTIHLLH
jgi:hypothetical protein